MTKDRLAEIKALAAEPRHLAPGIRAELQADLAEAVPELLEALDDAINIAQEVNQLRKDRNHDNMVIRTLQQRLATLNREHGKHFPDEALL